MREEGEEVEEKDRQEDTRGVAAIIHRVCGGTKRPVYSVMAKLDGGSNRRRRPSRQNMRNRQRTAEIIRCGKDTICHNRRVTVGVTSMHLSSSQVPQPFKL